MSEDETKDKKPFHLESGIPVFDNTRLTEIERKQTEAETRDNTYKSGQLKIQQSLRCATWTLVLAGIATSLVGGYQACTAKESADAARLAAETSYAQLFLIRKQAESALETQEQLSNRAIDVNRDISRNDQRAWLGVIGITITVDPTAFQPVQARISYSNSGKSPARNITDSMTAFISPIILDKIPKNFVYKVTGGHRSLIPGASDTSRLGALTGMKDMGKFLNQNAIFYVVGNVSYTDVFEKRHKTEFCGFTRRNDKDVSVCEMHQDSN